MVSRLTFRRQNHRFQMAFHGLHARRHRTDPRHSQDAQNPTQHPPQTFLRRPETPSRDPQTPPRCPEDEAQVGPGGEKVEPDKKSKSDLQRNPFEISTFKRLGVDFEGIGVDCRGVEVNFPDDLARRLRSAGKEKTAKSKRNLNETPAQPRRTPAQKILVLTAVPLVPRKLRTFVWVW